MISQELTQTLLPSKKEKLKFILDWAEEHCDRHQKEQFSKLIGQYDYMLTFPPHNMMRVTHAVDFLQHVPEVNRVRDTEEDRQHIKQQIEKRKKAVNGLITEIEELKHVQQEVFHGDDH